MIERIALSLGYYSERVFSFFTQIRKEFYKISSILITKTEKNIIKFTNSHFCALHVHFF